jgi:phosphatidylglycerophosphatase A
VIQFLATGGYVGYFPVAPGTAGSVVGLLIYLPLSSAPASLYLAVVSLLFGGGVYLSHQAEKELGKPDSAHIVIDEITGVLAALFMVPQGFFWALGAFLLFRIFDIIKPPPIRWMEIRLKGGWGIMADDLMAAVYANAILQGVAWAL